MENSRLSLSFREDIPRWLQSIVDYVKDTQANCLDLRAVPKDLLGPMFGDSFKSAVAGVNIEPILAALVGSSVTEVHIENPCLTYGGNYLSQVFADTNVTKLNICPSGLTADNILSLTAILKDTRITDLVFTGKGHKLHNSMFDDMVANLVNAHLTSLKFSSFLIVPLSKVSVLFESLPDTRITHLDLSALLFSLPSKTPVDPTELVQILMSNLQYTAITDLNLARNRLGDSAGKVISAGLKDSKLEKLNLQDNKITDAGVDFLVSELTHSQITHLNLGGNMTLKASDKLGHCLKHSKLKKLNLSGSPLHSERIFQTHHSFSPDFFRERHRSRPRPVESIPPLSVKGLRSSGLTHLNLSFNEINLEQLLALADFVCNSKLTHLALFKSVLPDEYFHILGESVKKSELRYINLGGTVFLHQSDGAISSFLENTKGSTIASLDLSQNFFVQGNDIIVPNLANTTFWELDLSRNGWSNHMASLAEQLNSTAITALYLDFNDIGDDGASILSQCLKETQIVVLDVKKNEITSIGAKAIALALKTTKLRHLDLGSNKIEDDGLESLAKHAENSCITYLNVSPNPGRRKLLVDRVLWENRRKIRKFADLLKQTALFTGDSNIFEFDRDFEKINIEVFIDDCLNIYKTVSEEPFIVEAIEQDKCILDLKKLKWSTFSAKYSDEVLFEGCELLYKKILESSLMQGSLEESNDVFFFKKWILRLILEFFPIKFVSFLCRSIEADVEQHVLLLRKIEEMELTRIVELLLLNRPIYVIDQKQDILHPYVYKLLFKYKQTICNTEIEPEGVEKIIQYFTEHIRMDYASEVIMLLNISTLQKI